MESLKQTLVSFTTSFLPTVCICSWKIPVVPTHLAPEKSQESFAALFKRHSSAQNQLWASGVLQVSIWFGGYFDLPDADQSLRSGAERLEQCLYLRKDNLELTKVRRTNK